MSLNTAEQYDKIYRYCYFKTSNASLAEDLTQETFLRYFSQSSYTGRGKQLAYLYTIAKNLCIDAYKRRPLQELSEEYPAPDEMRDVELQVAVKQALQILSQTERELLLLRYVNELPVGEICLLTGLSRFAVYRKTTAALALLKSALKEEDFIG